MSVLVITITITVKTDASGNECSDSSANALATEVLSAEEEDIVQDTVNRWNMMCEQRNMTNQPCIQYIED